MSGAAKSIAAAVLIAAAAWTWIELREDEPEAARAVVESERAGIAEARADAASSTRSEPDAPVRAPAEADERVAVSGEPARSAAVADESARTSRDPARVTALLLDESQAPLAGGRLVARRGAQRWSAETDASGRVELTVDADRYGDSWNQPIVVEAPGRASAFLEARLASGSTTALGEIALAPGVTVRRRVVGLDGEGVPDAELWIADAELPRRGSEDVWRRQGPGEYGETTYREYRPRSPEARSDGEGRFELAGIPAGRFRVWAKAEGRRYGWSDALETAAGERLEDIEIVAEPWRPEDRILGRVVDPAGDAVPNARLTARYDALGDTDTVAFDADGAGRFAFVVRFAAPHLFTAADPAQRFGEAAAEGIRPGTRDLVLRLVEKREIALRVIDERGEPIESVSIGITYEADERWTAAPAVTASRGTFRFELPALSSFVEVSARGYRSKRVGPLRRELAPESLAVVLEALPSVEGRVLADGEPATGARVRLVESHPKWDRAVSGFRSRAVPRGETVETDGEGRFRLSVGEERDYFVRAERDDRAPIEIGPLALGGPSPIEALELELPIGGAIEGRVLVAEGRDAAGVVVSVNRGDGFPRTQRADAEGRFRFERLAPGAYRVERRAQELGGSMSSIAYLAASPRIETNCTVVDGRATRFDLDLTREE